MPEQTQYGNIAGGMDKSSFWIYSQNTQDIAGSAITIATVNKAVASYGTAFVLVAGRNGATGDAFQDIVVMHGDSGYKGVLHSTTIEGTPAGRTYSSVASALKVLFASGTYDVTVMVLEINLPS